MTFQPRTHHTSYAAPCVKVNAERRGNTAEIVLFPMQRGLPPAALEFADAARDMINAVFGAQSRHQTCMNAARALGVSDDTVSSIPAHNLLPVARIGGGVVSPGPAVNSFARSGASVPGAFRNSARLPDRLARGRTKSTGQALCLDPPPRPPARTALTE